MRKLIRFFQDSRNLVAVIGLLVVVWLAMGTFRVILKNYDLVQLIDELEEEVAILELENSNLRFEINYFGSDAYLELEARDKLTRVAEGERLLVLPRDRYDNLDDQTQASPTEPQAITNFNAWLDFLFGRNR